MWPAEGSVCQSMLPLLAEARHPLDRHRRGDPLRLDATAASAATRKGHVRNPEQLYRPYKVEREAAELRIVFRDHALSDLIGFHYQRSRPSRRVRRLPGQACTASAAPRSPTPTSGRRWSASSSTARTAGSTTPAAASISCARCTARSGRIPRCTPVRVRDYLDEHPPRPTRLPQLFRRQLDQPQLRHLDRPRGGQHGLGRPAPDARAPAAARRRGQEDNPRPARARLGGDVHRRGQRLVLVVRRRPLQRPGRAVRLPVPQAPAERLPAAGRCRRRPSWPGRSAARPSAAVALHEPRRCST